MWALGIGADGRLQFAALVDRVIVPRSSYSTDRKQEQGMQ
jgi:hypothetical protein